MYIVLVCFGIVTISVLCTVIEIKTEVELICLAVCLGLSLEDLVWEQPIFKSAHNKKTTEGFFSRRFYSNPVVWLCDQEPIRTLQKGPPPEKAKLRRWSTYLSQLRLTVHHIQGVKDECADYISHNNFDALIGARSEALAKEVFSRMDIHLDLNMTMIRPPDGLQQSEYLKEFGDIYKRLEKRLEPSSSTKISGRGTRATSGTRTTSWYLVTESQRC